MSAARWAELPPELRDLHQFVVWHETTGGRPFCACDPRRPASSTDRATWSTFLEAVAACEQGRADGIGFVFTADDPFCGVDLDHCRDPETGAVLPAAQRIVDDLATYTEVSPSGTGLHLICAGKLPPDAWHKRKLKTQAGSFEVELYDSGRYFRMTGDRIGGEAEVRACQSQLVDLLASYAKSKAKQGAATPAAGAAGAARALDLDDAALIDVGLRSGNGFADLWHGDASAYPSGSEADAALCLHLAWLTGEDAARMDRMWLASGLMREKLTRDDYRERTIAAAIDCNGGRCYTGKPPAEGRQGARQTARRQAREAEAPDPPAVYLDWSTFWRRDDDAAEWLCPDVLARGRGHSFWAAHKVGKSLFALCLAAQLATGSELVVVMYLDYEMSEADVRERLEDMGHGPGSDLSRLRYALLPTLPPLDTAAGGEALMELVDRAQDEWPDHHIVVIVDTISRAVCGEENSADTIRDFYNHTGIQLKRRGVTWARLDHGGKDPARGQRGTSSKGDDVDVVWELQASVGGITLRRDLARMAWVPERVCFRITEDPLAFVRSDDEWPAGTAELANILDRLQLPLEVSRRTAAEALRSISEGRRSADVSRAIKYRRSRATDVFRAAPEREDRPCEPEHKRFPVVGNHSGFSTPRLDPEPPREPLDFEAGTTTGTTGTTPAGQVVPGFPPLGGNREPVPPGTGHESERAEA